MSWFLVSLAFAGDPPAVSVAPGKGIEVTTADGRFSIGTRGRFQLRHSVFLADEDLSQATRVQTLRWYLFGHVLDEDLTYTVQLALAPNDYRDGTISPVFDAFFDDRRHRDLRVKVGQFFVPFDRLRTVREFALQLPDRPRPISELTLDRDVGVALYSDEAFGSPLAWRIGAFGGSGANALGTKDLGGLVVGRLELRPLGPIDDDTEGDLERREEPGLMLGVGGAYNANTPKPRSTTGTAYPEATFDYVHAVADGMFKWRGFAAEGEILYRGVSGDVSVDTPVDDGTLTETARPGWGWVAQASYVPVSGWEVAARYAQVHADEEADPAFVTEVEARGNEIGAGGSRYINGHRFKIQAGWTYLYGEDPAVGEHTFTILTDATF